MIRRVLKLSAVLMLIVALGVPGNAVALPVANITYTPRAPFKVGQEVRFDGTKSTCDFPPCRYIWSWRYASGIVGGQMGEGRVVRYRFPAAAAGRTVAVVLKVVANTKTHGFGATSVRVGIRPLPPPATP
jgi:hypothetical protein